VTTRLSSTDNKGKKDKGRWVLCLLFFFTWVYVGLFILKIPLKRFCQVEFFFITKNLVIIYKLSTIKKNYYKERNFVTILKK